MSEASDLECLDAAAEYVRRVGADEALVLGPRNDAGRGVALVDAAIVRGLREWRELASFGSEGLIVQHGRIAQRLLPKMGREARRRLGS